MKESRLQSHILKGRSTKMDRSLKTLYRVSDFLQKQKFTPEKPFKESSPIDEEKLIERITARVLKSIPTPRPGKDGRSPTKEEIISLFPKVRDGEPGKDADEEKIISSVLSKIRIPKDGENATLPDLRELAINTINVIEGLEEDDRMDVKSIKGMRDYVWNLLVELWVGEGGPGIIFHDTTLTGTGVPGDPLSVNISSGNTSFNETPSGSGTAFVLAHTPNPVNSLMLYRGGALQQAGGADYTLSGKNITLNVALGSGEILLATYNY